MKAYIAYKAWWIEWKAPELVPSLYWGQTVEEAFERHVRDMGLYKLMECLIDWEDK